MGVFSRALYLDKAAFCGLGGSPAAEKQRAAGAHIVGWEPPTAPRGTQADRGAGHQLPVGVQGQQLTVTIHSVKNNTNHHPLRG